MFASIGALFLSQGTITGSYQEIQQLICDQKMEDARAVALSKAQAGDADGFIALGWFEEEGKFSKADNTRAFAYYTTAATLGSAHAQWKVGVMLDTGSGVKQDPKAAVGWFRKSARQKLGAAWSSLDLWGLPVAVIGETEETERLKSHACGHGAIANNSNHFTPRLLLPRCETHA